MVPHRHRQAEQRLKQAVDVRRGEQVHPPRDQRDAVGRVVDRHREVVARRRLGVLAHQHRITPELGPGGLHTLADVEALCAVQDEGIEGVICGRSIYEGTINLGQAQARADELTEGDLA